MSITINSIERHAYKIGVIPHISLVISGDMNNTPIYKNCAVQIKVDVTSINSIDTIKVYYKNNLESIYSDFAVAYLSNTPPYYIDWENTLYNAIIPSQKVAENTISYYVEVADILGNSVVSSVYSVDTTSAPDNLIIPLWGDKLGWGWGTSNITEDEFIMTGIEQHIAIKSKDLVSWDYDGRPKRASITTTPIETIQGKKWLYLATYIEGESKTIWYAENRAFYHIDDNPYLMDYPQYYDSVGGTDFWHPLQNTYNLTSPTGIPGDIYFQGTFYIGKPVVKDNYFYIPSWIDYTQDSRKSAEGFESSWINADSRVRIIKISLADLLLGKLFETYKEFPVADFTGSISESILIDDEAKNQLWLFVRNENPTLSPPFSTYVTVMDWATGVWQSSHLIAEGLPPKGFIDNDGTIFLALPQRNYAIQGRNPNGENSGKTFLYRHLPDKPYNQWETREYVATLITGVGYCDVRRFKGNLVYTIDGDSTLKVLDQYYKVPVSLITPILTLTNNILTATATATGTTATPQFFYSTDNVTFNPMPTAVDMGGGVWQSQISLLGIYGTIYVKANVTDNSILYESLTSSINKSVVLTTIAITPPSATVRSSNTVQLSAKGYDEVNSEIVFNTALWSVSDLTKATISSNGLFTSLAGSSGIVTVTCTDSITGVYKTALVNISNVSQPFITLNNETLNIQSNFLGLLDDYMPTFFLSYNGKDWTTLTSSVLTPGITWQTSYALTGIKYKIYFKAEIIYNSEVIDESLVTIFYDLANYKSYSPPLLAGSFLPGMFMVGQQEQSMGDTYGMCGTLQLGELPVGTYTGKKVTVKQTQDVGVKYAKIATTKVLQDIGVKYAKLINMEVICDVQAIEKVIVFLNKMNTNLNLQTQLVDSIITSHDISKDELIFKVNLKQDITIKQNAELNIVFKGSA